MLKFVDDKKNGMLEATIKMPNMAIVGYRIKVKADAKSSAFPK